MEIRAIDEDLDPNQYPIRPEDIDVSRHFLSAFGKGEVEIAAKYVVRFCQQLGGWKAFTRESLEEFYLANGGRREWVFNRKEEFLFYWLDARLLVRRYDGKYCVTNFFIDRCFASSPRREDS